MMTLKTICLVSEDSFATVFWSTSREGYNVLKIQVPRSLENRKEAAELIAIRYLLMEKKVFGSVPERSSSMRLVVSSESIRRLALRRSVPLGVSRYGGYLVGRLDGVSVDVQQQWPEVPELNEQACEGAMESIRPNLKKYRARHDPVSTPAMGELYITYHAAKRYKERTHGLTDDPNLSRAWARLTRRIQHPRLREIKLDDRVIRHKLRRYDNVGQATVWGMPHSDFYCVVVTNDEGIKTLVTIYYRNPNADKKGYGDQTAKEIFANTGMPA